MSETKHTPGPWKIRIAGTCSGRGPEIFVEGAYYDDGSEFVVAEMKSSEVTNGGKRWRRNPDADVIEANARLIAAAPDMLKLLKDFIYALTWGTPKGAERTTLALAAAAEIIAKVEGRA